MATTFIGGRVQTNNIGSIQNPPPVPPLLKEGEGGFSRTEFGVGEWCQCYLYDGASV